MNAVHGLAWGEPIAGRRCNEKAPPKRGQFVATF